MYTDGAGPNPAILGCQDYLPKVEVTVFPYSLRDKDSGLDGCHRGPNGIIASIFHQCL